MPYYADLTRVILEAANERALIALRAVVYVTPRGYICSAETIIETRAWLDQLFRDFQTREMPQLGADDIYVIAVLVPRTNPLEIIEQLRAILPEGMEQMVILEFSLSSASEDNARPKRIIEACFVTEVSLETEQPVPTTGGRAVMFSHGQDNLPKNQGEFWRIFADAIRETKLCEQVSATGNDLTFVLNEGAARTMLPSLLTIVSQYPS